MNDSPISQSSPVDEDEIDLRDLAGAGLQHLGLIVSIVLFSLFLGVGYALIDTPAYKVDALIQLERKKEPEPTFFRFSNQPTLDQRAIAGEVEVLKSREILYPAIEKTKANIDIQVENRFPILGNVFARQYERNHSINNEVSEPLFGMTSYAWGGERLILGDAKLPRQPVYVELTEEGFNIRDTHGETLVKNGHLGKRLKFAAYGESAYLQIQNVIGNPGTRFK